MTPSESEVAAVLRHLKIAAYAEDILPLPMDGAVRDRLDYMVELIRDCEIEMERQKAAARFWRLAFWIAFVLAVRFAVGRF